MMQLLFLIAGCCVWLWCIHRERIVGGRERAMDVLREQLREDRLKLEERERKLEEREWKLPQRGGGLGVDNQVVACRTLIYAFVRDGGGDQAEYERMVAMITETAGVKLGGMIDTDHVRALRRHTVMWCGTQLHRLFLHGIVVTGRCVDVPTAASVHAATGLLRAVLSDAKAGRVSRLLEEMASEVRGNRPEVTPWSREDGRLLLNKAVAWAAKQLNIKETAA